LANHAKACAKTQIDQATRLQLTPAKSLFLITKKVMHYFTKPSQATGFTGSLNSRRAVTQQTTARANATPCRHSLFSGLVTAIDGIAPSRLGNRFEELISDLEKTLTIVGFHALRRKNSVAIKQVNVQRLHRKID